MVAQKFGVRKGYKYIISVGSVGPAARLRQPRLLRDLRHRRAHGRVPARRVRHRGLGAEDLRRRPGAELRQAPVPRASRRTLACSPRMAGEYSDLLACLRSWLWRSLRLRKPPSRRPTTPRPGARSASSTRQKLDDAYIDPAMAEVEALLARVPPTARRRGRQRAAAQRIADGRAALQAAEARGGASRSADAPAARTRWPTAGDVRAARARARTPAPAATPGAGPSPATGHDRAPSSRSASATASTPASRSSSRTTGVAATSARSSDYRACRRTRTPASIKLVLVIDEDGARSWLRHRSARYETSARLPRRRRGRRRPDAQALTTPMRDQTFMTLMRLLPKSALSTRGGAGHARCRLPRRCTTRRCAPSPRRYRVDLDEAEHGLEGYPTFGEFFTRGSSRAAARWTPARTVVVSPVDGAVSRSGYVETRAAASRPRASPIPVEQAARRRARRRSAFERRRLRHALSRRRATTTASTRRWAATITATRYMPGRVLAGEPRVGAQHGRAVLRERAAGDVPETPGRHGARWWRWAPPASRASTPPTTTSSPTRASRRKVHRYERPSRWRRAASWAMFEMGSTVILLFEPGRVRWDELAAAGGRGADGRADRRGRVSQKVTGVKGMNDLLPGEIEVWQFVETTAREVFAPLRLRGDPHAGARGHRAVRPQRGRGDRHRRQGDVHLRGQGRAEPLLAPRGHRARGRARTSSTRSPTRSRSPAGSTWARCSATSG